MTDKRKNGATALFKSTPELVCLFSFLTQTYSGILQATNQIRVLFTMLKQ